MYADDYLIKKSVSKQINKLNFYLLSSSNKIKTVRKITLRSKLNTAFKENKNLKYYVQQAGSFTPFARTTGALVIHPDGRAASVKHVLWFKFYPSISPRSEIFVPQKVKSNRLRLGAGELALIVSALGILSNVIITSTK